MTGDRLTDAELMARVAAGDQGACRQLVDQNLGRVVGLAARMLGDRGAAEDVAQEAFLRLWRQSRSWRPDGRIATWLHRVAHNLCIDQLRSRRRLDPGEPPEQADPAAGPAALHQRRQVAAAVEAAIAQLPERQRTAITLVHHQELSNIDAAEIMSVSVEALESLLARGRRTLRARLGGRKAELLGETV